MTGQRETVGALLARAAGRLAAAGIPAADREAELLLEAAGGPDRGALVAARVERTASLPAGTVDRFLELVARREARVPLQHLLGKWPFLELDLRVDGRALVPRPETEDLALLARERLAPGEPGPVADVGTGGGCIALALAAARPALRVIALDRDPRALSLAAENARETGLGGRVRLVRGDLLEPVRPGADLALAVANLPYVREDEWPSLPPEVRDHDPRDALVGGRDGLDPVRRLLAQAPARLRPGGRLLLEVAPGQVSAAGALLAGAGFREVAVHRDRFGRDRVVEGVRP